ncbi:MAG: hypothetical protein NTY19_21105 [Planctomycetota bacterium]|nr:hypothetical protein [Planctomycetota bacterium]
MMHWAKLLVILTLAAVLGCGQRARTPTPDPKPPLERIRTSLEQVASSPKFGSEVGLVFGAIEQLKKTDPEQGQALHAEVTELLKLNGPARQAKAKAMLAKLPAAAAH